jgi:histidyl-tRNA synthetase
MAQLPSIPKGTRDFSPNEMIKRNYIFDTIRQVFTQFGYQPIETPAMENLSTLLGKYGEEGDRLLFRILNSGDFLKAVDKDKLQISESTGLAAVICEKGLRYDLTVPFARYVVMHRNDITFPFKRYQIQPVWRADRPQKARYREFYQCDVDVIGSNSLLNDVELIQVIDSVFSKLGIQCKVKINNRKILSGIAEFIGAENIITDITVAIDKLEKTGIEKVNDELVQKGINRRIIEKLMPILQLSGDTTTKLGNLSDILKSSEIGLTGIKETKEIFGYLKTIALEVQTEFDITLARGLNYYTGAIIEVKANDVQTGSICGGGRYDDLTGIFGLPGVSGTGVSFGADRIYDVMTDLSLFQECTCSNTRVLFINFGKEEVKYSLPVIQKIRQAGINAELYPDPSKIKKQMSYADANHIPFVVLAGETEILEKKVNLKNMKTGEQVKLSIEELVNRLK